MRWLHLGGAVVQRDELCCGLHGSVNNSIPVDQFREAMAKSRTLLDRDALEQMCNGTYAAPG